MTEVVAARHGRLRFTSAHSRRREHVAGRASVHDVPLAAVVITGLRVAVASVDAGTGPVVVFIVVVVVASGSATTAAAALAVRVLVASLVVLGAGAGQVQVLDELLESFVFVAQGPHLSP